MAAQQDDRLKVVLNQHLRSNFFVVSRIEMLTYFVYAPLSIHATP
jgi:hypothetical protein